MQLSAFVQIDDSRAPHGSPPIARVGAPRPRLTGRPKLARSPAAAPAVKALRSICRREDRDLPSLIPCFAMVSAIKPALVTTSARLLLPATLADCSTRALRRALIRAVHPMAKLAVTSRRSPLSPILPIRCLTSLDKVGQIIEQPSCELSVRLQAAEDQPIGPAPHLAITEVCDRACHAALDAVRHLYRLPCRASPSAVGSVWEMWKTVVVCGER
jgi:hypothetical protein